MITSERSAAITTVELTTAHLRRTGMKMDLNSAPGTPIHSGDKLVVLGRPDSLKKLESEAAGS